MRRLAACVLLAALALCATAHARQIRAFAVGPKFSLDWVDTRAHFHDKLLALVDARERTAGRPAIQRGADDVASHLTGRDLVTLPEDLGLMAAFTGSRGATARQAPDLTSAIVDLIGAYAPVSAFYAQRYPQLTQRGIPTRLLAVSLTDTFARTAVETAAELARRLKATVVVGVIMPQSWRIVCTDRATFEPPAGATGCDAEDPARVAALRSPDEPDRDYAYEATTDRASNLALVIGPDGRILSKQVKTYLVPDELPGALDLVPGTVSGGLSAVDTPLGRLGVVTSKDAWMPDVTAKLDEARVDVLVQPEFFVGDTLRTTGTWAPDTIAASGYSDLLRHPSLQALVLPSLTGNVLDFSADNQSAIAIKPRTARAPRGHLAGQEPTPGYLAVAPTAVTDPVGDGILQRRRALGQAGEAHLPSGPDCSDPTVPGACRGGQVEGVVWHDVTLREPDAKPRRVRLRRHGRKPFSANRPLTRTARGPQRNVALAARGRRIVAAFEERDHVLLARSRDGGRRWSRPRDLGPGQWPSVAAGSRGTPWVAFQRLAGGVPHLVVAHGRRRFEVAGDAAQWRPSIAATPAGAYVAWIDERGRFADDDLPRADVFGAPVTAAAGVGEPLRIDTAEPADPLAAKLDHDWAPSVAARKNHLLVAWVDFRQYDWDTYAAASTDGGRTFEAPKRLNDAPDDLEALDDTPRAAFTTSGRPLVAWTDYRKTRDPLPAPLYDIAVGGVGGVDDPQQQVDGHGADQVDSFAPALAPPFVAWQDHPRGIGEIRLRRLGSRRALRLQDRGAGGNAWRPALTTSRGRVVAAWEDERGRVPRIYVSAARAQDVP